MTKKHSDKLWGFTRYVIFSFVFGLILLFEAWFNSVKWLYWVSLIFLVTIPVAIRLFEDYREERDFLIEIVLKNKEVKEDATTEPRTTNV